MIIHQRHFSKRSGYFVINLGVSWTGEKLEDIIIIRGGVNEILDQGKNMRMIIKRETQELLQRQNP